ncbi:chemotaxis protein CheV [Bremerella cremea]|uniref:Chemotaxis protein CheV n=1 Tax=Blastopirellula marina TaxID=124 RepID=A0A2S8FB07_9BACT|nr:MULTISPECIES: chemotaxis protein [Pirellulaceae]PQO29356.1 chemotaxis protein CheV [Blastopirellula marina]RCS42660.1 chemotaxis protein CheV [Bremerella cremea]
MTTQSSKLGINTGILLEAGTNEAEILVFEVAGQTFGVNVAKVKEVLGISNVTRLPEGHASIEGVVRIRQDVVTLIDLAHFLYGDVEEAQAKDNDCLLLLEFNQRPLAFRVHRVHRIYRVSWKATRPLPNTLGMNAPITSVVLIDGKLVQILDFESIGAEVAGITEQQAADAAQIVKIEAPDVPIVFAEDSRMISEMIRDHLQDAGFSNIHGFVDGLAAWEYLEKVAEAQTTEDIRDRVGIVITDIEMPRMDGFSLAKHVRMHPVLGQLPILIFSSLVSKDNQKKGAQVGVDAQVSKPRYAELVSTARQLLGMNELVGV